MGCYLVRLELAPHFLLSPAHREETKSIPQNVSCVSFWGLLWLQTAHTGSPSALGLASGISAAGLKSSYGKTACPVEALGLNRLCLFPLSLPPAPFYLHGHTLLFPVSYFPLPIS